MKKKSRPSSATRPKYSLRNLTTQIALGAGKILLKYYNKSYKIEHKPGAGIVTEADKAAEAYVIREIRKHYPSSSLVAEESGNFSGGGDYTWIIDPLDGTSNFAHGLPWFCVSIGVHFQGQPKLGVIYQPLSKELYVAEKGKGATLGGKKIRVSPTKRLEDSLLGTGFYYAKGEDLRYDVEIFRRLNEVALGVRRPGSAALDLAFVASGRYDGFWERGLSPWDVAAGYLLVEEAGGQVSDYTGQRTDVFHRECVASNRKLHSRMIELIQS